MFWYERTLVLRGLGFLFFKHRFTIASVGISSTLLDFSPVSSIDNHRGLAGANLLRPDHHGIGSVSDFAVSNAG
jgi:hypothetical protein